MRNGEFGTRKKCCGSSGRVGSVVEYSIACWSPIVRAGLSALSRCSEPGSGHPKRRCAGSAGDASLTADDGRVTSLGHRVNTGDQRKRTAILPEKLLDTAACVPLAGSPRASFSRPFSSPNAARRCSSPGTLPCSSADRNRRAAISKKHGRRRLLIQLTTGGGSITVPHALHVRRPSSP